MKKSLTFLLLLLSLTISAQYRLDVGLGYDYPKVDFNKEHTDYHFENGKFSGYYGNVGLIKDIDQVFSYSFGLGYINRNAKNTSYPIADISNSNDSLNLYSHFIFGSTQLYVLAKFSPIKKVKLAFELGLNLERELYRINKTDDLSEFSWNKSININSLAGSVGVSYHIQLNKKISLYLQGSISKSVLDFGSSSFDPIKGTMHAPVDYRLKLGAAFSIFKRDLNIKERIQENKETKKNRKFLRQDISIKAGYIYKDRKPVNNTYYLPINHGENNQWYSEFMKLNLFISESHGLRLGFTYSQERFYFPLELDIIFMRTKIHSIGYYETNYGHSVPWGYSNSKREYNNYFTANSIALGSNFGIGIKLFRPSGRFNFIPVFKISPTFVLYTNVEDNYTKETLHYSWNSDTPGPDYPSYDKDSTYSSNLFSVQKVYLDFTMGAVTSYKITPTWSIEAEFGFGLNKTYSVNDIEQHLMDRLRFFGSISLSYNIRLSDKKIDPEGF